MNATAPFPGGTSGLGTDFILLSGRRFTDFLKCLVGAYYFE
jgi:hypothetical protein